MGFELFEKGSAPVSSVPSLTIQRRGLMSLNDAAFKLLKEPLAVHFLWDSEQRLIGIRAAAPNDLNAYPTRRQNQAKGTGPVLIAGTLFTRFIGLDTTEARRWAPELRDDTLIVDLKVEGTRVISNRERSRRSSAQEKLDTED
ncbi:hypothetical protein [Intrasporangium calvum]|uniref:hypothetical protein n=1 Tax=Intrasporangium calvum TaxID=53358 RepID=UPI000DF5D582|nr:hypothetical protein [Intrasporangium calvum]AXG12283.1 hypothetical protein DN585_01480 [Intrasporangium calvum]